jgi:hypothetical protein
MQSDCSRTILSFVVIDMQANGETAMENEGNTRFWSLAGVAAVITAIAALYAAWKPESPPPPPPKTRMGQLQYGFGLDHSDSDPAKWVHLVTPEACSDLCYRDSDCKAMTFVVSNQSCWLKYRVPAISANPDEVSAIRE